MLKVKMSLLVLIFLLGMLFLRKVAFSQSDDINFTVKSSEEALDLALKYTGFGEMEGFSIENNFDKAELAVINDDKTPFLHDRINGRKIWRVTFKDVKLSLPSHPDEVDEYSRVFKIFLDPGNGQLLKITAPYLGKEIDFLPEPGAERAESELSGSKDVYQDFVEWDNHASFYDALNSYGTLKVKEISASLVKMPAGADKDVVDVWSITFRGISPRHIKGRGGDSVPVYGRNFVRNVYNAKSGKLMHWTSMPRPDPKDTVYLNR